MWLIAVEASGRENPKPGFPRQPDSSGSLKASESAISLSLTCKAASPQTLQPKRLAVAEVHSYFETDAQVLIARLLPHDALPLFGWLTILRWRILTRLL